MDKLLGATVYAVRTEGPELVSVDVCAVDGRKWRIFTHTKYGEKNAVGVK